MPEAITSTIEFENSMIQIRKAYTGGGGDSERFLNLMHYLLGWIVGDAGKNFHKNHAWARIQLDLSRKYPENLPLGGFVMSCIAMLGIPCGRIADRLPGKRDRHGLYRWMTYFSEVVLWLHITCLGLRLDERTSYDPVRMAWLLKATPEHRIWFIRGVADSDGGVNVSNKTVEIVSQPNTRLIKALLTSLDVNVATCAPKGVGIVIVRAKDAKRLGIFNPEIETHKTLLLSKLVEAKTFQRHWPRWLEMKVNESILEGANPSAIRNKLLLDDNTYVKLKTIRRKQKMTQILEPAVGIGPTTPCLRGN